MFKHYFEIFFPLFIAIDVFGMLPIYTNLTKDLLESEKRQIIFKAVLASFIFGVLFIYFGNSIFSFLGITQFDFLVGGGVLLFCIALSDLLIGGFETGRKSTQEVAIVPLAIPLILGPGSLTALLIISAEYGKSWSVFSLLLNLFIVWLGLKLADRINRMLGEGFNAAMARIVSLFLLAISVMMIRKGIVGIIGLVK
jgi:multiple antibiotic resistance protein